MSSDTAPKRLLDLYRNEIRPLLVDEQMQTVESLDRAAEVLETALKQRARVHVGFLGEAQVGKSSLINALLGRAALPAGGIGPLTAQATRVSYAEECALSVRWHARRELHRHAWGIEQYLRRCGLLIGGSTLMTAPEHGELEQEEGSPSAISPDAAPRTTAVTRMEYMLRQGQVLIARDVLPGEAPPQMLLDALRAALGQTQVDPAWPNPLKQRIKEIADRLGMEEHLKESELGGRRDFDIALKLRAAGWLSPLIAELHVSLDTPFVRNLTLVDLPGIGVAGDPSARIAETFVREEGQALVLVMRNSGLTESLAMLLERTGVITKLLFGGTGNIQPINVLVAITHLDDVAREHYRTGAIEAREAGAAPPDRHALFERLADDMCLKLREQLRDALRRSSAFDDLPADHRARREAVIDELSASIIVRCVAAPDFMSIEAGLDDDAFLRKRETTGIPAFREDLLALARDASIRREGAIQSARQELHAGVTEHLEAVGQRYADGAGRAVQTWDIFRAELSGATEQLRPEMAAYHGEVLATLRSTIPVQIESLTKDAQALAMKKLARLRSHGESLYWASLDAALRYDGVWDRRDVNYPDALTRSMVDAVATDWEPKVIEAVRSQMRQLAERNVALVERLCENARRHDERIVIDAQIETQKKILQQQARTCIAWTKDRLDALRSAVQKKLYDSVQRPFTDACKKALLAGRNRGPGAKRRILDTLGEAGAEAVEAAGGRAVQILRSQYQIVLRELEEGYLKEHHDPLKAAFDALTNQELHRARRADSRRRQSVLGRVTKLKYEIEASSRMAATSSESLQT